MGQRRRSSGNQSLTSREAIRRQGLGPANPDMGAVGGIAPPPQAGPGLQEVEQRRDDRPVFKDGLEVVDPTDPTSTPYDPFVAPRPASLADAGNIFPYGNFEEEGVLGWEAGTDTSLDVTTDQELDGLQSCEITATAAAVVSLTTGTGLEGLKCLSGTGYKIKAGIRAATTTRTWQLTVKFYDATGTDLAADEVIENTNVNSAWSTIELPPLRTPDTAIFYSLHFETTTAVADAEVHYLDLVEVTPISGMSGQATVFGTGVIESANFIDGVDGWHVGADGSAQFNNVLLRGHLLFGAAELYSNTDFETAVTPWDDLNGTATRVNTQAHGGTWSCQIANTSATLATMESEEIPCEPDEVIWTRGWFRFATGSGDRFTHMNIKFYNAADTLLEENLVTVPANVRDTWLDEVNVAQAPANTDHFKVELGGERPTSGSITLFVDDLTCKRAGRVEGAYLKEAFADKLRVERLTVDRVTYKLVGCIVARNANQSIPSGVVTSMSFDTNPIDTPYGNMHTPTSANITIREDGQYLVSASTTWASTPAPFDGLGAAVMIELNNVLYSYSTPPSPIVSAGASASQYMLAGQLARLLLWQVTGSAINVTGGMSVHRVVTG